MYNSIYLKKNLNFLFWIVTTQLLEYNIKLSTIRIIEIPAQIYFTIGYLKYENMRIVYWEFEILESKTIEGYHFLEINGSQ